MIERMRKRFAASTAKWWFSIAALLGMGMLPCPDCGAPMIWHFWPIAGLVLIVRALKRRYRDASPAENEAEEGYDVSPIDHRRE